MLISCNWLKDYIDIKMSPLELAEKLSLSGLPVEEIKEINSGVTGVVVARVQTVEKHPNADNLSLCDVTDGKEQLKIVCGAKNIAPGQLVPLAKDGASLPGGIKIKIAKIRDIESFGMLCSSKELGMDDSHAGILILNPDVYELGAPFVPYAGDTVLSLEITPNRPDLLCITGVARFIALITGAALKYPGCDINKEFIDSTLDIHARLKVDNRDTKRCPRYSARLIEGVTIKDSPAWLKDRLIAMGIRPINNVVDVTNYVMLEINQPLHAFDHKKIKNANILIRTAVNNEKITALDGKTYELKDSDLVIADTKEPIAIAGVMGGEHFSIDSGSTTVVLESAFFSPKTVRKTSRSMTLSSDSSYRFERGIDIDNVDKALNRAAGLIIQVAGGMTSRNIIDIYPEKMKKTQISLRFDRVNKILGTAFTEKETMDFMRKLNFISIGPKNGSLTVEIPAYRADIQQEVDLIEDIAQVYGYDNIPSTLPASHLTVGSEPSAEIFIKQLQQTMTGYGFSEVKNYSFLNNKLLKDLKEESFFPADAVELKNPFNEEETRMKTTLIPDLIKNLISNKNNETESIHLFETANVYTKIPGGYTQSPMLAAITCGHLIKPAYNHREFSSDFTFIKTIVSDVFSALKAGKELVFEPQSGSAFYEFYADLNVDGVNIGKAGQVKEEILYHNKFREKAYMFEIDVSLLIKFMAARIQYIKISRFPVVKRDLSIIVKSETPAARVEKIIRSGSANLVKALDLYDLYRGGQVPDGCKSLTYSIIFQSDSRTLSDEDINSEMSDIVQKLKAEINAELRS
jgi:phenylalanyl-tRNA synthetase beta chain